MTENRPPLAEEIEHLLMEADREGGEVYRTDGYTRLADYLAEGLHEKFKGHSALADYWDRRLNVVSQALLMIPDPGKIGGLAGALNGQGVPQTDRVPLALKIARFAADGERDIPGVDECRA